MSRWAFLDEGIIFHWRIQREFRGFARCPLPASCFKMSHENEIIWWFGNFSETKLFHYHGIFYKNEITSQTELPYLYTYQPPFQKSWILFLSYVTMSSCNLPQRIFLSFLGEGSNIASPGKGFIESLIAFLLHRSFPREEPNHNAKSKYYQNYENAESEYFLCFSIKCVECHHFGIPCF